jgi:hypothetical protein
MKIEQQIAIGSSEVANLIETHKDVLEEDGAICEVVRLGRYSLEFFLASEDAERALWEVNNTKEKVMQFLGLV